MSDREADGTRPDRGVPAAARGSIGAEAAHAPHRHAIFACPARDDALTALAARWLGHDPWTGQSVKHPSVERIKTWTEAPRRYGFHGTIIAPFRRAPGIEPEAVDGALQDFAAEQAPIPLPLSVGRLGPFFALVPQGESDALRVMEARAVRHFHPLRAEPGDAEIARRNPERLSERQRELLRRWHYPFVLDEFRFHMTLTGPIEDGEAARVADALARHFSRDVLNGFTLDALARYDEPAPGAPFRIVRRVPFEAPVPDPHERPR